MGVAAVQPVAPGFVRKQVELVLADLPITHIKTGMIGTVGVTIALGQILRDFSGEIICDPVLIASDGQPLMEKHGLNDFLDHIVANATVITPNLHELAVLAGTPVPDRAAIPAAVELLFSRFSRLRGVVVTGGHLEERGDRVTDFLFQRHLPAMVKEHPRHATRNTHGTGCTFTSALTAYHLIADDYEQAFRQAVAFMDRLIAQSAAHRMGKGTGPLLHHLAMGKT
jgi:hydroxymethylpyrimidine/phosphomethylpyrimidine kinase